MKVVVTLLTGFLHHCLDTLFMYPSVPVWEPEGKRCNIIDVQIDPEINTSDCRMKKHTDN